MIQLEERMQRGKEIASRRTLFKQKGSWFVPSSKGNRNYRVRIFGKAFACTCLDHETTGEKCKHIFAVEHSIANKRPVGRPPKKEPPTLYVDKRPTYPQNWPAYNAAQTNEKRQFQCLLSELCQNLEEPVRTKGRPALPL